MRKFLSTLAALLLMAASAKAQTQPIDVVSTSASAQPIPSWAKQPVDSNAYIGHPTRGIHHQRRRNLNMRDPNLPNAILSPTSRTSTTLTTSQPNTTAGSPSTTTATDRHGLPVQPSTERRAGALIVRTASSHNHTTTSSANSMPTTISYLPSLNFLQR